MKIMKTKKGRNKQRGIALIVAMLALLLLSAIGVAFMFMSDAENNVTNNYKDSQKAYFASRAGLENVRVLLVQGGSLYTQVSTLSAPASGANTGVLYVKNSIGGGEVIDPTTAAGSDPVANPMLDD